MAVICPTILAENPHQYREQLERVEGLAERVQIDLTDGQFAGTKSIEPGRAYWPRTLAADIHLMYERPLAAVEELVKTRPHLIIVHAEADHAEIDESLRLIGNHPPIKRGLALLPQTNPEDVAKWLKLADHCLIFSGDLGHFGGQVDMAQTRKIGPLKDINPHLEIGWDGGVNDDNAAALIAAGVDVLNVGGFIQKSSAPDKAYAILRQIASTA